MSEMRAHVLAMAILDNEEVIKKPVMASTIGEVEAELRQTCVYLSNSSVKRILVYDNFFEEYVDLLNRPLEDRDKIKFYFTSSALSTVRPPSRPSTSASSPSWCSTSASPSMHSTLSTPYGTSQTTLMFGKDGLTISKEPPVVESNEASEKEIEERSKIYGKDGKPVNRYGEKINAMSFALAKKDPSLLVNRGNLLEAARRALHDAGYEYANGNKTRSQKFGRHQKEKEVGKYTHDTEVELNEASEKEIEERSKIYGKDGKPVNRYGEKINAMSFALAKKDPSLLLNRGNLLEAARRALHDAGYKYAHGNTTRSQKFGRHQKEKEVLKYTRDTARRERATELNESISSLQKQAEYLEKAREEAVNSGLFCEAAALEHEGSELKVNIRQASIELMEIEKHRSKLLKRRISRKQNKEWKKECTNE